MCILQVTTIGLGYSTIQDWVTLQLGFGYNERWLQGQVTIKVGLQFKLELGIELGLIVELGSKNSDCRIGRIRVRVPESYPSGLGHDKDCVLDHNCVPDHTHTHVA